MELIDTLWNVNTVCLDELTEEQIELIDTLWNVNIDGSETYSIASGINRYIMECKLCQRLFCEPQKLWN